MTELFDDTDLRTAFREFADGATPYVRPPGAGRAQHDARGRIRNRRVLVACAAAVAVLVPAAVVALTQGGGPSSLPQPPATDPVVTTPTPIPTVTLPNPTTTASPEGEPTTGPGQLLNTTLTLSWQDPSADAVCGGNVTITDSHNGLMVLSTMVFDIDRDGTNEIVANVFCQLSEVGPSQLVAIRRDGGTATVLGTVLASAAYDDQGLLDPPGGPGVAVIRDYAGLDDGTIRVFAANRFTCCGTPQDSAVLQRRTFQWTGSSFEQVAGPTAFVADPSLADIEVTVPTLAFSAPVDGFRSATLSVTIHNNGPQTATEVSVFLNYGWRIEEPAGDDWDHCGVAYTTSAVCRVGDIAAGQTVTLVYPMRRSSQFEAEERPSFWTNTGLVEARVETPGDCCATRYYPSVTYTITAA
jgi:hypothetical protein